MTFRMVTLAGAFAAPVSLAAGAVFNPAAVGNAMPALAERYAGPIKVYETDYLSSAPLISARHCER